MIKTNSAEGRKRQQKAKFGIVSVVYIFIVNLMKQYLLNKALALHSLSTH